MVGLTTTSFAVAETPQITGTVTISDIDNSDYTFTTTITNAATKDGLKAVKVVVWNEANGQDDIEWQNASKQSDGSYKIITRLSSHSYLPGLYNVHVYYDTNNGLKGLTAKTTTVKLKTVRIDVQNE
ncbi:hypothetical protein HMPREF9318_02023 [Streptococcus urinalis FB127-CNA-2]|uniref:GBS Bsp-like repeat protein n=1 Tax=Streptococcus urinalis 2285-97 TaxID=764291 RepID=G5KCL4_9STRE|nr:GBS Bsp-like repeat-containing protein [Streptococcus urinalis]EHJ57331.1 GBS Bsp-like repeat protein [Streptococcus urinalis 2285-97]EKS17146.1 hypothetical protein HMPREF9318_02023 [Streptococcus urinalis FB127-CNA-2]VEF32604.1 autolysin [Streptococcus urinalis]